MTEAKPSWAQSSGPEESPPPDWASPAPQKKQEIEVPGLDDDPATAVRKQPILDPMAPVRVARGAVVGALGFPGDIESALRWYGKNLGKAGDQMGLSVGAGDRAEKGRQIFPGSSELSEKLPGKPTTPLARADEQIGEFAGPGVIAKVGSSALRGVGRFVDSARGLPAKRTAEAVRKDLLAESRSRAASAEGEAKTAAERQAALESQQAQVRSGRTIAEQRAARRAQNPDKVPEVQIRQKVLADLRDAERAAVAGRQSAEANVAEVAGRQREAEARLVRAEQAADELDATMVSRPSITKQEFGERLGQTVDRYVSEFSRARAQQSGYAEAVKSAGETLVVGTTRIIEDIDGILKRTRNPDLQRVLGFAKEALTTGVKKGDAIEQVEGLSVGTADSLRKYLDRVISSKQFQGQALDRETLKHVRDVKTALVKTTGDAYAPYKQALGKWSTLSRPLDIIERNASLKKVAEVDPLSLDRRMAAADVAGAMIRDSARGNKAFATMLQYNPELKDASRLYFSKILFGKETPPTPAQLRNFLQTYEAPLKQSGLYGEFRDLRVAKEAAGRAVAEAKDVVGELRGEMARASDAQRLAAGQEKMAESLRKTESERLAKTLKTAEPIEDIAGRAQRAEKSLGSKAGEMATRAERARDKANAYRTFETQISQPNLSPKEIAAKARELADGLVKNQLISQEQYADYLKRIAPIAEQTMATAEARRQALKWTVGLVGTGVGEEVVRRAMR